MTKAINHETIEAALAAAQAELTNPDKSKEAVVKGKTKTGAPYEMRYKYADIADVLNGARPALSKHGVSVVQKTAVQDGMLMLQTALLHAAGEIDCGFFPVCHAGLEPQKIGAAMTYARRYALCAAIGVAAEEDVDAAGDYSAPPRSAPVQTKSRPKAAPGQAAPEAEEGKPPTGVPQKPTEAPREIKPGDDTDASMRLWAASFANILKGCNPDHLMDWLHDNTHHLDRLMEVAPKLKARLDQIAAERIDEKAAAE